MDVLRVGLRLHALHADGEYYTAEVVQLLAPSRGSPRPVKVKFAGYEETAWRALSELRSKVLRGHPRGPTVQPRRQGARRGEESRAAAGRVAAPTVSRSITRGAVPRPPSRRDVLTAWGLSRWESRGAWSLQEARGSAERAQAASRRGTAVPNLAGTSITANQHAVWTPQTECGICYRRVRPTEVTMCGHFFCDACLQRWRLEGQNACPHCRQPLALQEVLACELDRSGEGRAERGVSLRAGFSVRAAAPVEAEPQRLEAGRAVAERAASAAFQRAAAERAAAERVAAAERASAERAAVERTAAERATAQQAPSSAEVQRLVAERDAALERTIARQVLVWQQRDQEVAAVLDEEATLQPCLMISHFCRAVLRLFGSLEPQWAVASTSAGGEARAEFQHGRQAEHRRQSDYQQGEGSPLQVSRAEQERADRRRRAEQQLAEQRRVEAGRFRQHEEDARVARAAHVRAPSPDRCSDCSYGHLDHELDNLRDLDNLREERPELSDDALWDLYHDRMHEDAEEYGGSWSDGS